MALSFFLIPVARHNILLAAMGWSPMHALRLHIYSGYLSFGLVILHGVLCVATDFIYGEGSVLDQILPDSDCWKWNPLEVMSLHCTREWFNLTGIFAGLFFTALVASSFNWFRRHHYRWFYICHVTFGVSTLIVSLIHWRPLALYISPSIIYYLASTSPALIQALSSHCRGGVKIVKVVRLTSGDDAGGCMIEVRIAIKSVARSEVYSRAMTSPPAALTAFSTSSARP